MLGTLLDFVMIGTYWECNARLEKMASYLTDSGRIYRQVIVGQIANLTREQVWMFALYSIRFRVDSPAHSQVIQLRPQDKAQYRDSNEVDECRCRLPEG